MHGIYRVSAAAGKQTLPNEVAAKPITFGRIAGQSGRQIQRHDRDLALH